MRSVFQSLKKFLPHIIFIFIFLYIQAMTDLALPDIMSQIVNNGIAGVQPGTDPRSYIIERGIVMLAYALVGAVCSILVGLISAIAAAGLGRSLRSQIFQRVTSFSSSEFERFSTASLITRSTNDIQQIQHMAVMALRILFYAPILGIGGILRVLRQHGSMAWIIAVAVFLLSCLVLALFFIAMPRFKALQKLVDRLNLVTREMLTGLLVIRAFNTNRQQEEKFRKANRHLTDTHLFVNRLMILMMPAMMLIMNGITLLIVWIGAEQIDNGTIMIGDMMAFIQYTMQIIMAFLMISMGFIMLPRAAVSAGRIHEVLTTQPTIQDDSAPQDLPDQAIRTIRFDQVSFCYPQAIDNALTDLNFELAAGQTTALIGSTGSGKSTLAHLILRFHDATTGRITIDGLDIRSIRQADLRARIGYVPQKPSLFSGTIHSNLAYGNQSANEHELRKAAHIAQADDMIDQSEKGLESEVSQAGANFSGGQKQRLAIARALARSPQVLIFDDSFSALDYRTDARLRQALHKEIHPAAVLIISQRIATIRQADQILVLDQGRIAGRGTHTELLQSCSVYQEIAASQLTQEELLS